MFRAPLSESPARNADGALKSSRKSRSFLKLFLEKFGKSIDGRKRECSLEHLSPSGERFFEIYFVRLIGTPNQHIPS